MNHIDFNIMYYNKSMMNHDQQLSQIPSTIALLLHKTENHKNPLLNIFDYIKI